MGTIVVERLATLETKMDDALEILNDLKGLPIVCSARGVEIEQLHHLDIDNRLDSLERSNTIIKWFSYVLTLVFVYLSGNVLWNYIQRMFT